MTAPDTVMFRSMYVQCCGVVSMLDVGNHTNSKIAMNCKRNFTVPGEVVTLTQHSMWLSGVVVSALRMRTRRPRFESRVAPLFHWVATLQVVYTHCLPSCSAPRNRGTKGSFRHLSGYGN